LNTIGTGLLCAKNDPSVHHCHPACVALEGYTICHMYSLTKKLSRISD